MPTYIKIVLRFFDSGKNSTFAENFREAGAKESAYNAGNRHSTRLILEMCHAEMAKKCLANTKLKY